MLKKIGQVAATLALGTLLQALTVGCSADAPLSPLANSAQTVTIQQNQASQIATAGLDSGPADEKSTLVEFDVLLLTPDLANSTIQLFDMRSTMLIGHVDENTVLLGMEGEAVTLGDFMVCFKGHARGTLINSTEIKLEFLQMLPF